MVQTEMRPLKSRSPRDLVRLLHVAELDASRAVDLVVAATGRKLHDTDWKEIHDFVLALWRRERKSVVGAGKRLGAVRVPAGGPRMETQWIPARETYFSADWLNNDDLEALYRPFRRPEFLAVTPPVRGRKQLESFYRLLGVADTPRQQEYLGSWRSTYATIDEFGTNAEIRWSKSIEQYDRIACHHHPQSQRVRVRRSTDSRRSSVRA